jgi:hypothetical protein
MKIFELLAEEDVSNDISTIKQDIINQVQQTNDTALLNKVYTALHSTGLTHRIRGALTQLSDTKNYLDKITNIILNTEGTVQIKQQFAEGLLKGYVNLDKMTSGDRVHFEDLIQTNETCKDRNFLLAVFQNLKNVGREQQKGAGEFALAVFSPAITIIGKGDLKIGNKIIEVKASAGTTERSSGGRIGTTGDIAHSVLPIFARHFGKNFVKQNPNINLNTFYSLMKTSSLTTDALRNFATELFRYMFKKSVAWVDLEPLINATANKEPITKEYARACYQAYKGPKEAYKFDGIMLMNFALQELRYYEDFDDMFKDSYPPTAYIMYQGGKGVAADRLNIPQFTLKRQETGEEPLLPQQGETPQQVSQELANFAQWYANNKKIGRNTQAVEKIKQFLQTEWNGNKLMNSKKIITKLNANLNSFTGADTQSQTPAV